MNEQWRTQLKKMLFNEFWLKRRWFKNKITYIHILILHIY